MSPRRRAVRLPQVEVDVELPVAFDGQPWRQVHAWLALTYPSRQWLAEHDLPGWPEQRLHELQVTAAGVMARAAFVLDEDLRFPDEPCTCSSGEWRLIDRPRCGVWTPGHLTGWTPDDPVEVTLTVPRRHARQWRARARAVVRQVVAADAGQPVAGRSTGGLDAAHERPPTGVPPAARRGAHHLGAGQPFAAGIPRRPRARLDGSPLAGTSPARTSTRPRGRRGIPAGSTRPTPRPRPRPAHDRTEQHP